MIIHVAIFLYTSYTLYLFPNLQDTKLTKEEILEHQDVFVGSRATEWGEYLNRHDEF